MCSSAARNQTEVSYYLFLNYELIEIIIFSLGLVDKPGKPEDLYHTCYCLSGLSIAQNFSSTKQPLIIGNLDNEVLATHPLYNISPKSVIKAYCYAQKFTSEADDELIVG